MIVPAIIKILIIFVLTLLLTRIRIHLGISLIIGGIILNYWAGIGTSAMFANLGHACIDPSLWLFVAVNLLMLEIGRFITEKENADDMIAAVKKLGGKYGSAFSVAGLPAVIGFVPFPAGALFSAPFVQQIGERVQSAPDWKTAVNYWFRHVWEYWWPLYPGVLMAMQIFNMIPQWEFVLVLFVFSPVAIILGWHFLITPEFKKLSAIRIEGEGSYRRVLFISIPLLIALNAFIIFPVLLVHVMPPWWRKDLFPLISMVLGMAIANVFVYFAGRNRRSEPMFSHIFKAKTLSLEFAIIGVLIFKSMLDASNLVPFAAKELTGSGVPVELIIIVLPFVAAMVTGVTMGFVGPAFPLMAALAVQGLPGCTPVAVLVLGYGFGYMGEMLSPIHLCIVMTKEYFTSSIRGAMRLILPCAAGMLIFTMLYYMIFRWLGI